MRARAVVVATNSPVNDRLVIHTKQAPYRTYVVGARVRRGAVPRLLLWDTADPYHYVRLQPIDRMHDLLIVGGEDHKTGQAEDMGNRYRRLEKWMRERFPAARKVEFRWSGQVMEPVDGLAFIGRNPLDKKSVFIATGFSGTGMTYGTIAGMLLTDLVQGRRNDWADTFDPSRKTVGAATEFAQENLNVVAQYSDLVTPGEVEIGAKHQAGPRGRSSDGDSPRSPSIATKRACWKSGPRSVRTWAASSAGTGPRRPGTARATARATTATDTW